MKINSEVIITNQHSEYHFMGGKVVELSPGGVKVLLNIMFKEVWFFKHEVSEVVGYSNHA